MKKILLILVAVMFTTAAFAQQFSVGARVGSGFQAVGQYKYDGKNYIEARFGSSWNNNPKFSTSTATENYFDVYQGRVMVDFTLLHNWHLLDMDWTPRGGMWFFDAGVGVNVGGVAHYAYVGVAGMARLGFTFNNVPVTLALDWTPTFGPGVCYVDSYNHAFFNELGLANIGISCTYNF
jgi:hypothetical protein